MIDIYVSLNSMWAYKKLYKMHMWNAYRNKTFKVGS